MPQARSTILSASATLRIDAAELDRLFAQFDRTDAPGFAVGVSLQGKPVYRRGFGMASIELPVTLSPSIRMRIGSTTKHFTALAVLLLAEVGRLSLEDSPRRYVPELPHWAEPMTLLQLMAHTSGMRDSFDLILHASGSGRDADPAFQVAYLAGLDSVNLPAGASWNYNNGGYVLLAEIVARVSGQPFADFLREQVFEPVGMVDTVLRPLDTDLVSNSATLHLPTPDGRYLRGVFGTPLSGEGGMVSTVDDMLRWLKHMARPAVGTPSTWSRIRTPVSSHGYGLGLWTKCRRGLTTIDHAGAVVGGSSQMVKVLGHELDVVLLSNGISSLEGYRLVDAIIDLCIPGLPAEPVDVPGEAVAGNYYSVRTGRKLSLSATSGKQMIAIGGMTLPARRDADGSLEVPILPTDMRLKVAKDAASIELEEFGEVDHLDRVEAPTRANKALPKGSYESAAASLHAVVAIDAKGVATLDLTGPLGYLTYILAPIAASVWEGVAASPLSLVVLLEFDGEGFQFSTARTVRLRFLRVS